MQGSAVLKYGMTKELVEGIEVVLPNGEILNSIKNMRKIIEDLIQNIFISALKELWE